jgi:4-diphosphocytidyl-2-C-methyl-D-erythritol kinase
MIKVAIKQGNIDKISRLLYNTLEEVVIHQYPVIKRLKEELLKAGALGALMSGSGSAIFGIVKTKLAAINIYDKLKGGDVLIFVTKNKL